MVELSADKKLSSVSEDDHSELSRLTGPEREADELSRGLAFNLPYGPLRVPFWERLRRRAHDTASILVGVTQNGGGITRRLSFTQNKPGFFQVTGVRNLWHVGPQWPASAKSLAGKHEETPENLRNLYVSSEPRV